MAYWDEMQIGNDTRSFRDTEARTLLAEANDEIIDIEKEIFEVRSYPNFWDNPTTSNSGTGVSFTVSDGVYDISVTTAGTNKGRCFRCEAVDMSSHTGEDVTVSAALVSSTLAGTPVMRVNFVDANGTAIYSNTEYTKNLSTSSRQSKTIPVPENAKYLFIGLYTGSTSTAVGTAFEVKDIQAEFGSSATEYHVRGSYRVAKAETDVIPYNDRIFCNGAFRDIYNPYKIGGANQYKGQMHCHHTSNDGTVLSTMQQIYNNYKTLYDFMVLTDYSTYASLSDFDTLVDLNTQDDGYDLIQLCKGFELKVVGQGTVKQYHMIVYCPLKLTATQTGITPIEMINTFVSENCIVDFPHPAYSNYTSVDMEEITGNCHFIEVCNGSYLGETQWDTMLSNGNFVFGLGVSDCHGTGSAIDIAWVKVFAESKTRMNIFESVFHGNFYASNGGTITSASIEDGGYKIITGDANASTSFIGQDGTVLSTVTGGTAEYKFTGSEKYVRAKVTLSNDTNVWTQPVFFSPEILNTK